MSQDYQVHESPEKEPKDARVSATSTIWTMATGMLALCIPLVGITRNPLFPMLVLAAAAVSTIAVWTQGAQERIAGKADVSVDLAAAQKRLTELEERLANLETISVFEQRLAAETAARQVPQQAVPEPVQERESTPV
ncbi:MAG TPA: hypothetical protein VNA16_09335 [Abditibacteriaceae bacterium]|nr:hypothetical protein [Abditibacteriaceae bacterium]